MRFRITSTGDNYYPFFESESVELNTLEELIKLMNKAQQPIIIHPADNTFREQIELEIYDDHRE